MLNVLLARRVKQGLPLHYTGAYLDSCQACGLHGFQRALPAFLQRAGAGLATIARDDTSHAASVAAT
jgi:hypothetical protein